MPDLVNPTTLEVRRSEPVVLSGWLVVPRGAESVGAVAAKYAGNHASLVEGAGRLIYTPQIEAVDRQYRKWVTDHVEEMTAGEKATADVALLTAQRDAAVAQLDRTEDVLRAVVQAVMDELNSTAAAYNALRGACAAATSVADLRTRANATATLPTRTLGQIRTAIRARIGT
jgi:hypothetical protein